MSWLQRLVRAKVRASRKDAPATGLRLFGRDPRREWWELVKLNLLFVVFSLPLVTLPAAHAAAVRISVAMVEDRNIYLWRDFRSAFVRAVGRGPAWPALVAGGGRWRLGSMPPSSTPQLALMHPAYAMPLVLVAGGRGLRPGAGGADLRADRRGADGAGRRCCAGRWSRRWRDPGRCWRALGFVAGLWLAHVLFYPASVLMPVLFNFSLGVLAVSFGALSASDRANALQTGRRRRTRPNRAFAQSTGGDPMTKPDDSRSPDGRRAGATRRDGASPDDPQLGAVGLVGDGLLPAADRRLRGEAPEREDHLYRSRLGRLQPDADDPADRRRQRP